MQGTFQLFVNAICGKGYANMCFYPVPWPVVDRPYPQICFRHSRTLGKKNADPFMEAKAMWNLSITCQKSEDFTEALSNAELASQICAGAPNKDNIEKLAEEIKEWMIKRVESEIKDSGL